MTITIAHGRLKCVYCVDTEVTTLVEYNSTTHSESESIFINKSQCLAFHERVFKYIGFDKLIRHIQNKT